MLAEIILPQTFLTIGKCEVQERRASLQLQLAPSLIHDHRLSEAEKTVAEG